MATKTIINVPKKEYGELREKARLYDTIKELIFQAPFFEKPTTKNTAKILKELKKTGKYNQRFLKSIERGLKESACFSK